MSVDDKVHEIDHGAELWKSWDRVWQTQLKRGLKKPIFKDSGSTKMSKSKSPKEISPPLSPRVEEVNLVGKSGIRPGRGKDPASTSI